MDLSRALRILLIASVLASLCSAVKRDKQSEQPHIIFIVADDLGWDDVSFHGSPQIPTKNIDHLANDGVILNNYYVSPICTPTRASIMTGKYPIHLGMQHFVIYAAQPYGLPLDEITLPQYLKSQGYRTAGVGKWHLGFFTKEYTPTYRGFDSFFGFWGAKTDYWNHSSYENNFWGIDMRDGMNPVDTENGVYGTELFTLKADEIIKNHDVDKPLFLYVAHQAVHSANVNDPLQTPRDKFEEFKDTIEHVERRKYAAMVTSMDQSVGSIYKALENKGMLNNSVIIFTTDNGGAPHGFNWNMGSNYPFRGGKDMMWEGGVRGVAFVYSDLIAKKGRVSYDLIDATDWTPTLFHLAGGNSDLLHPNIDGKNVWSTISEGKKSPRDEVLHGIDPWRNFGALRKGRYKLVIGMDDSYHQSKWHPRYKGKDLATMDQPTLLPDAVVECGERDTNSTMCDSRKGAACLFDMEKDPCEYNDLSKELPNVVAQLQKRWHEFRNSSRPVWYPPIDKAADPAQLGGYWGPWKHLEDKSGVVDAWNSLSTLLAVDLIGRDVETKPGACNMTEGDIPIQNDILPNVPSDIGDFISGKKVNTLFKSLRKMCDTEKTQKMNITWTPFKSVKICSSEKPVNVTDRFYYRLLDAL